MNALKTTLATLTLAAATLPAFANDGVPPDLRAQRESAPADLAAPSRDAGVAPYLHGLGEVSLVANPAYVATAAPSRTRVSNVEIRRHSVPATHYVGA
ncbi:MAG: hypothetical protein AB7P21_03355 [Lautropia sp.]